MPHLIYGDNMTLIVTLNGRESIWLLADRRLSYKGRDPKDEGRKVMFLDTPDGVAILGYAGLGATALGTEPADWMSAVLRGRKLSLEKSLGVLARAMKEQLPPHLLKIPDPGIRAHNLLVTAFLKDDVKLYTIDLVETAKGGHFDFRFTQHISDAPSRKTPRIGIGGTGAQYLLQKLSWVRPLLRLNSAYDRGKVSARSVADHLASLNYRVHQNIVDKSVGPKCIVAWRNKKTGVYKGGGGHQFYSKEVRDNSSPSLPAIVEGIDINALIEVVEPHVFKLFESMSSSGPEEELNKDEINKDLARLPNKPDENLK